MKNIFFILTLLCSIFSVGQDEYKKAEVFGGYQYTHVDFGSGAGSGEFNGWNGAVSGFVTKNFGVTADFAGAYKTISGVDFKLHSYMFGPTLRVPGEKGTPFVHALFGGAHANAGVGGVSGSDSAFAYALGGGVDLNPSDKFAIRVLQLDFVGTRFSGENQHHIRLCAGIVLRF